MLLQLYFPLTQRNQGFLATPSWSPGLASMFGKALGGLTVQVSIFYNGFIVHQKKNVIRNVREVLMMHGVLILTGQM